MASGGDIGYARCAGGIDVAYKVMGDGPVDIVYVPGFVSHLDLICQPAAGQLIPGDGNRGEVADPAVDGESRAEKTQRRRENGEVAARSSRRR